MNKTLRATLLIGVLGLMIIGLIYRESQLKTYKSDIFEYEKALEQEKAFSAVLKRRIEKLKGRADELQLENDKLLRQNKILGDSVLTLNAKVKAITKKLRAQTDAINSSGEELLVLRKQSDNLVNRVSEMRQEAGADKKMIQELDDQRAELDKQIGVIFLQKDSIERENLQSNTEFANLTREFEQQKNILEIVENVQVAFEEVHTRRANNRKARRINQWDYTLINMQLSMDNLESLRGEKFIVKIIDKDNNKVLPPRESNGSNDTEGESFIFNGNPVPPIRYSNYQKKEGKNFMIQVFYINKGKEYPLSFGAKDIKI